MSQRKPNRKSQPKNKKSRMDEKPYMLISTPVGWSSSEIERAIRGAMSAWHSCGKPSHHQTRSTKAGADALWVSIQPEGVVIISDNMLQALQPELREKYMANVYASEAV